MRIIVICALALVNIILESTLFQYTRIYGIKPDFSIIIIVAYAILRGSSYGAFIGLGFGMLVDILFGRTIGINALSYMITGYIIGQAHETVFKDSYIPAFLFNFSAVFIYQHLFFMLSYFSNNITGTNFSYLFILLKMIIPQAIYNAVLGAILYRYLYRLDEMPFMNRRLY
ncbi:MAG: rod shape-determining protein MreD [Caulobacteraceae bacterium]